MHSRAETERETKSGGNRSRSGETNIVDNTDWEVPTYETIELSAKQSDFCLVIPIINEGDRIRKQLVKLAALKIPIDTVIADGGSTDGSTDPAELRARGVSALLTKKSKGGLSSQLRMGFAYALGRGYKGVVTVDGNGKDGLEAISLFIEKLNSGYDFIQGSRYLPGGEAINTPLDREIGVKLLHAPVISLAAGFQYTDTTNGFRAFSAKLLTDKKLKVFRDIFDTYNLHYYISVRAPRLGFRIAEVPVSRAYPKTGKTPTKISNVSGKILVLKQLFSAALGLYNP
jgi:dolichol-phosphate mannosyltransferase